GAEPAAASTGPQPGASYLRLRARGGEGIPRRLVPTHDRDAEPDRRAGGERQAAGPGRRLPAVVSGAVGGGHSPRGASSGGPAIPARGADDRSSGRRSAAV